MWQWPWISRGRLDDARATIAELKDRIQYLESEEKRLVNLIMLRHNVRPIFPEPENPATVGPAPAVAVAPEVVDPLERQAMTPVTEAVTNGARSARAICADVESILSRRHLRSAGVGPRKRPAVVSQAEVASQVEQVLKSAQPNGNH